MLAKYIVMRHLFSVIILVLLFISCQEDIAPPSFNPSSEELTTMKKAPGMQRRVFSSRTELKNAEEKIGDMVEYKS